MARVAIALGSNMGDRERRLRDGIAALDEHLEDVHASAFHETDPVGVAPQAKFLNAAVTGSTTLPPADLLRLLLQVERRLGRERPFPGAPRTIDLDLILYDDRIVSEPGLVVPHPRFRERRFVLEPLAEIAAEWKDPVTQQTVAELLELLDRR